MHFFFLQTSPSLSKDKYFNAVLSLWKKKKIQTTFPEVVAVTLHGIKCLPKNLTEDMC